MLIEKHRRLETQRRSQRDGSSQRVVQPEGAVEFPDGGGREFSTGDVDVVLVGRGGVMIARVHRQGRQVLPLRRLL